MQTWKLFGVITAFVLVADFVWLSAMKSFYSRELGEVLRRSADGLAPRWGAAVLVYVLIPAGIVLFVRPHLSGDATPAAALGWGAVFGLILYGVYDLTNLAMLDKWTLSVTAADMAWGSGMSALASLLMRSTEKWLGH